MLFIPNSYWPKYIYHTIIVKHISLLVLLVNHSLRRSLSLLIDCIQPFS